MGLKVLSALDTAKTQYYHFKAIIIAGMGLFSDAYDLFCIAPVTILLGRIYYSDHNHKFQIPAVVVSAMVAVALLGTALGQLVFGLLGDRIGRKRVYGFALILMVLSSFGCGFSICRSKTCVLLSFGFFRFLLGVGIGGDYPLSATIMSEYANKRTRGAFIAAVFSMQGIGILFSSMVTMTVCAVFDKATNASKDHHSHTMAADLAWRIILMLGAVPAAITFYWRMKMPETARYTALVEHNVVQATKDMETVLDVNMNQIMDDASSSSSQTPTLPSTYPLFSKQFLHHHGRDLFSCAATWFLLDVVFYSNNLFQSNIYKSFLPSDKEKMSAFRDAYTVARLQAIITVCAAIPGYWATVLLIDRVGRRNIQMMGFTVMAAFLFAVGVLHNAHPGDKNMGFMFLYGLTFFFSNFGPNTTTFIVPAELFPARFRATCHGISGAAGKVGAIIGSIAFLWASQDKDKSDRTVDKGIGMTGSLVILGVISLVGAVITFLFTPETMGRSLEDNEIDNNANLNNEANGLVGLKCLSC
ncbi:probable inorganic phosphate transporter 1-10 [Beta vulgaris subsp. vulgaris]|uniref:probable inorganic phosphate transporter 1-10 n=1 Tax=Beta vulgaris subsp. vulgaris TaxID=3555 RepID=UPI002036A8E4|nr:probable inorganic phosphate transporter 1-10 [Beta vulgaris subsp. vulgaris]